MMRFEDFREQVRRRKAKVWVSVLKQEGSGRPPGRRPRDPEQEAILTKMDRYRIQRSSLLAGARLIEVEKDSEARTSNSEER